VPVEAKEYRRIRGDIAEALAGILARANHEAATNETAATVVRGGRRTRSPKRSQDL
jgi:hypothetical protein